MNPATNKKTVLQYALEYAANGFYVLPIHYINEQGFCSCGDKQCKSPGKHPATMNGVDDCTKDEERIKVLFRDGRLNIAIATWPFQVADIDPRNGGDESWDTFVKGKEIPDTPIANTGGGGYHYLFNVPEGQRLKKPGKGVDIKKAGGYIVVEPSNHHSGGSYEWEGAFDPLDGQSIATAPDWMLESTEAPSLQCFTGGGQFIPPEKIADLRSALCYLDPEPYGEEGGQPGWFNVLSALHEADNQNAMGLAQEWSQGSSKYTADGFRKQWQSLRKSGNGITKHTVDSVFFWAEQNGWANPAKYKSEADEILKQLVEQAENTKEYETIEPVDLPYQPFPVPALNELCEWLNSQLGTYDQFATQACALSIASALTARNYKSAAGDPAHLYVCISSDSIGSVRKLKALSHSFLARVNCRAMIRSSRMTSAQVIYRTLLKQPVIHYVADDYGQMMAFAKRQPSGLQEQAMNVLSDIYVQNDLYLDDDIEFGNQGPKIVYSPGLVMLAMVSSDLLPTLFSQREIGRGALEQFVTINTNALITNDKAKMAADIPASIQEKCAALKAAQKTDMGDIADIECAERAPNCRFIRIDDDVKGIIAHFDHELTSLIDKQDKKTLFPLAAGAKANLRRIINVLSAFENPQYPMCTPAIAEFSGKYVKRWLEQVVFNISLNMTDDGKADEYQMVSERIASKGGEGMTEREIVHSVRAFRRLSNDKRGELLQQMRQDKEIFPLSKKNNRGRLVTRLVHRNFIKNTGDDDE